MSGERGTARRRGLVIEFPLRGEWLVASPPSHPRFAFDVVAVQSARLLRGGLREYLRGGLRSDDSLSWSAPVTSPIDGVVVAAADGTPDRRELHPLRDVLRAGLRGMTARAATGELAGNHVIVEGAQHRFLLAHLRCGTVAVRAGDRVSVGDVVGNVGNSGNSVAPHLHMQTVSERRLPFATAPPFDVREYEQWRRGRWEVVRMAPLPRFGRVRVR